jgi:hypothetical protein
MVLAIADSNFARRFQPRSLVGIRILYWEKFGISRSKSIIKVVRHFDSFHLKRYTDLRY